MNVGQCLNMTISNMTWNACLCTDGTDAVHKHRHCTHDDLKCLFVHGLASDHCCFICGLCVYVSVSLSVVRALIQFVSCQNRLSDKPWGISLYYLCLHYLRGNRDLIVRHRGHLRNNGFALIIGRYSKPDPQWVHILHSVFKYLRLN